MGGPQIFPLVNVWQTGKSPCFIGKSTNSMGHGFNSELFNYQRVNLCLVFTIQEFLVLILTHTHMLHIFQECWCVPSGTSRNIMKHPHLGPHIKFRNSSLWLWNQPRLPKTTISQIVSNHVELRCWEFGSFSSYLEMMLYKHLKS